MLSPTSIAQQLLQTRFQQAVDVSATFDNCFFNSYAAYLLANDLPLPADLFTFESILGDKSKAKPLQAFFPNQASLTLFENYSRLQHPSTPPLSPHFMVEKTLVLGVLLREWFATQLAQNGQHRDLQCPDIITRFTSYKGFRAAIAKDELLSESNIYLSNESFLEYYVARPKKHLTDTEKRFEQYFQKGSEENAIVNYWRAEGYNRYCNYLARLHVKLASTDVIPVLESLRQPMTIYNTDLSIKDSIISDTTRPPLEIILVPDDGHYKLLKNPNSDVRLLDEYKQSQAQYIRDRQSIQDAMGNKVAIADSRPSLLVKATCLSAHVPWDPCTALLNKLGQMKQVVLENSPEPTDAPLREDTSRSLPIAPPHPIALPQTPEPHIEHADSAYFERAKTNFMQQLEALKVKYREFRSRIIEDGDDYDRAYNATKRLYNGLKVAGAAYFQNPSKDSYDQFKEDSNAILQQERGVLETHRRWRNVVYANIAIAIACLACGVILYPAVLLINKMRTGHFFFSTTTDSASKINAIEESIEKLKSGTDEETSSTSIDSPRST